MDDRLISMAKRPDWSRPLPRLIILRDKATFAATFCYYVGQFETYITVLGDGCAAAYGRKPQSSTSDYISL